MLEWSNNPFCWRTQGPVWIATFRIKSGTDTQLYLIILLVFINRISALKLGYETECDSRVYITEICCSAPLIYFILAWKWERFLHSLSALSQCECSLIFLSKAESHNSIKQHVVLCKVRLARIMGPFGPSSLEYFWGLLTTEKESNSKAVGWLIWGFYFCKFLILPSLWKKLYFRLLF